MFPLVPMSRENKPLPRSASIYPSSSSPTHRGSRGSLTVIPYRQPSSLNAHCNYDDLTDRILAKVHSISPEAKSVIREDLKGVPAIVRQLGKLRGPKGLTQCEEILSSSCFRILDSAEVGGLLDWLKSPSISIDLTYIYTHLWFACLPAEKSSSAAAPLAKIKHLESRVTSFVKAAIERRERSQRLDGEIMADLLTREGTAITRTLRQARGGPRVEVETDGRDTKEAKEGLCMDIFGTRVPRTSSFRRALCRLIRRVSPWRIRFNLLGESWENAKGEHVRRWAEIDYQQLERDKLWEQFGWDLNCVTLEFEDAALEKGFEVDQAQRKMKSPVCTILFALAVVGLALWLRYETLENGSTPVGHEKADLNFWEVASCDPLLVLGLFLIGRVPLHFMLQKRFHEVYKSNFHALHFVYALFAAFCGVFWLYAAQIVLPYYSWPANEITTFAEMIFILGSLFDLQFLHTVLAACVVGFYMATLRWIAYGGHDQGHHLVSSVLEGTWDRVFFVLASGFVLLLVKYSFEKLERRDFVLSLNLATESDKSEREEGGEGSERLLLNVLPRRVIDFLKGSAPAPSDLDSRMSVAESQEMETRGPRRSQNPQYFLGGIAEAFDHVSILFSDVVGFTEISSRVPPETLVQLLDELFTRFDDVAEDTGMEKIKTVGDAYMAACGLPIPDPNHAVNAARMGLGMIRSLWGDLGEIRGESWPFTPMGTPSKPQGWVAGAETTAGDGEGSGSSNEDRSLPHGQGSPAKPQIGRRGHGPSISTVADPAEVPSLIPPSALLGPDLHVSPSGVEGRRRRGGVARESSGLLQEVLPYNRPSSAVEGDLCVQVTKSDLSREKRSARSRVNQSLNSLRGTQDSQEGGRGVLLDDRGSPLRIRVGIHSGSAVAGVIGRRKFIYDVWGDCVNTASRMESHGEPGRVHCSEATAGLLRGHFELERRGQIVVKGKGPMNTYFVSREIPGGAWPAQDDSLAFEFTGLSHILGPAKVSI